MGHRTVMRVPLDFDEPLNEVWRGYLTPDELRPTCCPTCGPATPRNIFGGNHFGDGLTPEARAIDQTFYSHMIGGPNADALAWHDKLGQAEVDHLVAEGRLRELQTREPTEDNPRDWEWVSVPRAAREVNALNRRGGMDTHDGINRWILCEFRCAQLGIERPCPTCEGEGSVYASDEQRAAHDAWEPTEPPDGDGWQLWTTTTEGSPISPVFETAEALADWCTDGATAFASIRWSAMQWLASFRAESTDVDTLLMMTRGGEHIAP